MKNPVPRRALLSTFFPLLMVLACNTSSAKELCEDREETIFSFQEKKSKKLVTVCKGANSSYLVYRFGTEKKIELQYPDSLNNDSWRRFAFSGLRRGGGKTNGGFGDYSLSFINGSVEYFLFQSWSDEEGSYTIGINVQVNGKSITLEGDKKTQRGSLVLLDSEASHIENLRNQ